MRLGHISDLHIARPARPSQWTLKRLLGRASWHFIRRRRYLESRLPSQIAFLAKARPDAVLLTGDVGQTGLPQEFEAALPLFSPLVDAGIPVLCVTGNHDHYGREGEANAAFARMRDTLSGGLTPNDAGLYRIGDGEILLLDQGVPTPLFCAWGAMDSDAIEAITRRLPPRSPDIPRVAAAHYPLRRNGGNTLRRDRALRNAAALEAALPAWGVQAYFCGHMHKRFAQPLAGGVVQYAAQAAGLAGMPSLFDCTRDGVTPLPDANTTQA